MKILAIDSSGLVASAALLDEDILVGEYTIHNRKTHSQTLLPMVRDMLAMAGVEIKEIEAIAVAAGPGSFTGLRIGAATAKGLAQALEIPIVAVPTLEGLAFNQMGREALICPLMDARRSQAYFGIYDVGQKVPMAVVEQSVASVADIVDKVNELGRPVVFLGDGVPVFLEYIKSEVKVPHQIAPEGVRYQRAAAVAELGKYYLTQNKGVSAGEFAPVYLRLSQAERERMEREQMGHAGK